MDDHDEDMPKSKNIKGKRFQPASNFQDSMDISGNSYPDFECDEDHRKWCIKMIESGRDNLRRFTGDAGGPYLWNTFIVDKDNPGLSLNFESEQDFFTWCSEAVHSFDQRACQWTNLDYVKLWLKDVPGALICHHREGSFDPTVSETLKARCFHVANVVSVSCFLFCLRIGTFKDGEGSMIDKSRLIEHLSALLEKWKWSGKECRNSFDEWIDYIQNDAGSEKEEALKLLFQWTLSSLESALSSVELEILGASWQNYAEVDRVSKWGNEVCDFLEEYRMLLKASEDTEFLHDIMFKHYSYIADLYINLGNYDRATKLLTTLKDVLEDVKDGDLMVTKWRKGEIEYLRPENIENDVATVHLQLRSVSGVACFYNSAVTISRMSRSSLQIGEESHRGSDGVETNRQDYIRTPFDRQLDNIIRLTEENRYSEAREIFKQIDLERRGHKAILRKFIEYLNKPEIELYLHSQISPGKLESLCERQELLLDVSEALLGDRQLTAKLLQQYAKMIGIRSKGKYQKVLDAYEDSPPEEIASSRRASLSYLWLKEEFNLQLTLPEPECIQTVISCLRDPCESGERKLDKYSDTLKTYRLWKRSIDIFSDLLHNWSTQGTSREVEWLKLLESQKIIHDSMLCFLFEILQMCDEIKRTLESNDSSVGGDNGLKGLVGNSHSSLLVYRALVAAFIINSLVWVERGRARTLLTQLGPWYDMRPGGGDPGSLKKELIEFDKDEQAAISSIQLSTYACKAKTLFIEYVIPADENYLTYFETAPKAFMTNEQNEFTTAVHVSNNSCAADGRFDKQVEELVKTFYDKIEEFCNTKPLPRRLEDGLIGELHRVLEKLYDLLIEPFCESSYFKHLDPKATIVFVPDKMLYRVPFALLRDKRTQKYLFQLHPIAISPSLRVLRHCERQLNELDKSPLKPDGCILAVGDAAYETNLLPGTKKELEYLHSAFPGRVNTLEQGEATRAKFLELVKEASRSEEKHVFAFIHLGVHGHWSNPSKNNDEQDKPYKTGSLQFAKLPVHSGQSCEGPKSDLKSHNVGIGQFQTMELEELKSEAQPSSVDEIRHASSFGEVGAITRAPNDYRSSAAEDMLPSEDIINGGFQWRTRLVVLSACNSVRGQGYSDGEVNLPRALMIAGVPAAVVSQWKVSDVGSPKLMRAFYECLQQGQDVATALQSAMIQLSNDPDSESASNIFEWGPFLVWGLPTVQLPKEMLTEDARKALSAKQQAEMLRSEHSRFEPENVKVLLLNALQAVHNQLAIEDEAIIDTIVAVQMMLHLSHGSHLYEESIQLAEEFLKLLPFERLEKIELELENRSASDCKFMYDFRNMILYTQAMKGNYLKALECVDKMKMSREHGYITNMSQIQWLNRGVILRLMGNYEEALKSFDDVLANGEILYECLIQISYLKYLMKDNNGALEYALKAKKYEILEFNELGYGAFTLSYKALPDKYRNWLLNVVDSTGASSSCIWDSLNVEPSKELVQTKNANQQIKLLRSKFNCFEDYNMKFEISKVLNVVDNFFASMYNACVLEEEGIVSAIIAMEHLLEFYRHPYISNEVIALGEEFYSALPFEQSTSIEVELEKQCPKFSMVFQFRLHLMYTLAIKGSYQIALEHVNKMTKDIQIAERCGHHVERMVQYLKAHEGLVRQERAVILRLMGKYDKALKQFEEELAHGEDYDCLIQTSYLKHLMKDDKGALDYALRAKILEDNYIEQKDMPGYGAFILGNKALPHGYRQWLLSVNRTEDDNVKLGVTIILQLEPLLKMVWATG